MSRIYYITGTFCLSGVREDVLEETVLLGKTVDAVVSLTTATDVTAEGVGEVLADNGAALLVDLGDRDLDRRVVLGLDEAVSGRALARNVKLDLMLVLCFTGRFCSWFYERRLSKYGVQCHQILQNKEYNRLYSV